MGLLHSLRISASALAAQRLRMDVVANNVANMEMTRTADGGPYQRQTVVFQEQGREVACRPGSTPSLLNSSTPFSSGEMARPSHCRFPCPRR